MGIEPSPDRAAAGAPGDAVAASVPVSGARVVALAGLVLVASIVAARMADRLVDVAGLTLAAVALSLLTAPVQRLLARPLGSSGAIVATAVLTLAVTCGLGAAVVTDLGAQLDSLAGAAQEQLDDLTPGSLPDRVAVALHVDDAVAEWSGDVPTQVVTGQDTGTAVGRQLMSLFFVVVLAAFLQASRRAVVDNIAARWPRDAPIASARGATGTDRRVAARAFVDDVERWGAGFARAVILTGAVAAAIVGGSAALLGVPGALVLALWAGAWCVVPSVGWFVATLPIAALAAIDHEPRTIAVAAGTLVVAIVSALFRRAYLERHLRLGASVHVAAVAVGAAAGGMAGTLVAVVTAALVAAAVRSPHWPGWPPSTAVERVTVTVRGRRRSFPVPTASQAVGAVVVAAAGAAFVLAVLERLVPAIAWLLIGAFVAIALRRPADWLHRRGLGPYAARAAVLTLVGTVVVVSIVAGAHEGAQASSRVADRLPRVVEDLERAPLVGNWLEARDASTWVSEQIADVPQRLRSARPASWVPGVTARLVDLWWTMVLAAAFLFDGERLVRAAVARAPASRRRQTQRLVDATGVALTGYAAGATLLATINGSVVFTIAVLLGLGLAPVVAVWAFVWNFVPQIGGFMGGVPLILFALVSGPAQALVASGLFLAYQLLENHVIQPSVIGAAIDVPPWGTLLAALAGGAAAGVLGAVLLTPLVGVARVIRRELRRDDFPGVVAPGVTEAGRPAGVADTPVASRRVPSP